jgi:hypothetical protein
MCRDWVNFCIGDIAVTPFTIPHDAADPVGFVFVAEGIRIGLATDLGYMPTNVRQQLRNCDVLMIESNHDLEMLRDGPYPWSVKQRVMSRVGHLSNEATAEFLEKSYDGGAAYVVLAHLSESNNLPDLAKVAAERALRDRMSLLANKLLLAHQERPLATIQIPRCSSGGIPPGYPGAENSLLAVTYTHRLPAKIIIIWGLSVDYCK